MYLCSLPTDKTVNSQAVRVGKQPAIPQGEKAETQSKAVEVEHQHDGF